MGTWGTGIFENDTACDVLDEILGYIENAIEEYVETDDLGGDDIEGFMGYIASLTTLLMSHGNVPPDREKVAFWKTTVLHIYDEDIDEYHPSEEFKRRRRDVLEHTFQALEGVVKDHERHVEEIGYRNRPLNGFEHLRDMNYKEHIYNIVERI